MVIFYYFNMLKIVKVRPFFAPEGAIILYSSHVANVKKLVRIFSAQHSMNIIGFYVHKCLSLHAQRCKMVKHTLKIL